jgi:hypothetical protein
MGTPRKLGVPGDDLPKVTPRLIDPRQYEGSRVLVVGGGDSALEAALQIADETDAEVTLSYRQPEFGKAREANKRRFRELVAQGRVKALMASKVLQVTPDQVMLERGGQKVALPNDFVLACLGGELPTGFLQKVGVGMRRLQGESLTAKAERGSAMLSREERDHRRLAFALFVVGALTVALLAVVGWDYYKVPVLDRPNHPAHVMLRPSGPIGHGIGVVSTLVMLSNFIYAVRKRWTRLKGFSSIRTWLTFHQFVGFMSPLVIAFHAAFQSNNHLATLTAVSLSVVVLTGVVGRFIFGLVPSHTSATDQADLAARWHRLSERLMRSAEALDEPAEVEALVSDAMAPAPEHSLAKFLLHVPRQRLRDTMALRHVEPRFRSPAAAHDFADSFRRLRLMQAQVTFFRSLKVLLNSWRVFHVVLSVLLVGLIAAHIGVSLLLGYRWIFS